MQLQELKAKKELNNADTATAVELLSLLGEDYKAIIENLMELSHKAMFAFVAKLAKGKNENAIKSLMDALKQNDDFTINKNEVGITRGFQIVSALFLSNYALELNIEFFCYMLKKAISSGNGLNDRRKGYFQSIINKPSKGAFKTFIESKIGEADKKLFDKLLEQNNSPVIITKIEMEPKSTTVAQDTENIPKGISAPTQDVTVDFNQIVKINSELKKIYESLSGENGIIANLKSSISSKEIEIANLNGKIQELQVSVHSLEKENKELILKNLDLDERLKKSYQVDDFIQNQELVTLKLDIKDALKPQFKDFKKELERGKDEMIVYKMALKNIFRALKQFEITFE